MIPRLEPLEDRLTPATLNIDAALGVLTYTSSPGVNNHLTLQGAARPTGFYQFFETGETITLAGDTAGWSVAAYGTGSKATGPNSALYGAIDIDLGDGANVCLIGSGSVTASLDFINAAFINVSGAGDLRVNDFGATHGNGDVRIAGNTVTGIAGPTDAAVITYSGATSLTVNGSVMQSLAEVFTVDHPDAPLTLHPNSSNDTVVYL